MTTYLTDVLSDSMSSVEVLDGALKTVYSDPSRAVGAAVSQSWVSTHSRSFLILLRDSFVQFYEDLSFAYELVWEQLPPLRTELVICVLAVIGISWCLLSLITSAMWMSGPLMLRLFRQVERAELAQKSGNMKRAEGYYIRALRNIHVMKLMMLPWDLVSIMLLSPRIFIGWLSGAALPETKSVHDTHSTREVLSVIEGRMRKLLGDTKVTRLQAKGLAAEDYFAIKRQYELAVKHSRRSGDSLNCGQTYNALGLFAQSLLDAEDIALEYHKEALKLARSLQTEEKSLEMSRVEAVALGNIGTIQNRLGSEEMEFTSCRAAFDALRRIGGAQALRSLLLHIELQIPAGKKFVARENFSCRSSTTSREEYSYPNTESPLSQKLQWYVQRSWVARKIAFDYIRKQTGYSASARHMMKRLCRLSKKHSHHCADDVEGQQEQAAPIKYSML